MKIYEPKLVTALAAAMADSYPGDGGQGDIKLILLGIGIDFARWKVSDTKFELTLNDILGNLNQSAGLSVLFPKLAADPRQKVIEAIEALVAAEASQQTAGFELLSNALLIVDGDPLVDHENLATNILPSLLDDTTPLRAVIMTGPSDSGKTFSLGLIRRLCREAGQKKKFVPATIDLTKLASARDSEGLVRLVVSWLRLDQFVMPRLDTSEFADRATPGATWRLNANSRKEPLRRCWCSIIWTRMSRRASSILRKKWHWPRPRAI